MKKLTVLFFYLGVALTVNAQLIQKSELEGFRWFTDNSIKSFYKSDTISLIRITDTLTENLLILNKDYRELDYNKNNNITRIELKKKNDLDILDLDIESWMIKRQVGKWEWDFDFKKQIISFYFNKKNHSCFLVKEKLTDTLVWKYSDLQELPKEAVFHFLLFTLIRVKLFFGILN